MAFDFIHGTVSTIGTVIPGGNAALTAQTSSLYAGISAAVTTLTSATGAFSVTSSLGNATKLFFVNGLLVSSSA